MELGTCPYCESRGLALTVKTIPGGVEVSSRCRLCGYACDSDYTTTDSSNDLPWEYSPTGAMAAD